MRHIRNLAIISLFIITLQGCFKIEEPDTINLYYNSFYSNILFKTESTETTHISICETYKDSALFKYIYRYAYKVETDSVIVAQDSIIKVYVVDKYRVNESRPILYKFSGEEYINELKKIRQNAKSINDTVVEYRGYIWDKRVLQKMYNKYILNNTSNMYN